MLVEARHGVHMSEAFWGIELDIERVKEGRNEERKEESKEGRERLT